MKTIIPFLALATALCGQAVLPPMPWDTAKAGSRKPEAVATLTQTGPSPALFISGTTTNTKLATLTWSSSIMIHTDKGDIRVDCKTGEVELPKDMTITVASFEFWKAIERSFPEHFKRSPNGPHIHYWGKWSEPEISSDWYNGTRSFQKRVCEGCGLGEARVVQIYHSTK